MYAESQAFEAIGNDGKQYFCWARKISDAFKQSRRWAYKHGGVARVNFLRLRDEKEGCWDRAVRIPITETTTENYTLTTNYPFTDSMQFCARHNKNTDIIVVNICEDCHA